MRLYAVADIDSLHICAYSAEVQFEWDALKATLNRRKHGIDFADVVAIFDDDRALTMLDECSEEERFVTIGRGHLAVSWSSSMSDVIGVSE